MKNYKSLRIVSMFFKVLAYLSLLIGLLLSIMFLSTSLGSMMGILLGLGQIIGVLLVFVLLLACSESIMLGINVANDVATIVHHKGSQKKNLNDKNSIDRDEL